MKIAFVGVSPDGPLAPKQLGVARDGRANRRHDISLPERLDEIREDARGERLARRSARSENAVSITIGSGRSA